MVPKQHDAMPIQVTVSQSDATPTHGLAEWSILVDPEEPMRPIFRYASALGIAALLADPATAQQQSATTIEKLLTDGWEVAGYVSAFENRSLILFKHKEHRNLVQCSVLIDVMRSPRVVTYCYEIK
jgi:hypothetical protein